MNKTEYQGFDFRNEVFLINRDGKRIPLEVEEIEFNPCFCYPRISGNLIGRVSTILSKKETRIEKVIFNDPATVVFWSDNTKTVVKCQEGDTYSKELGLAMCISKKFLGNKGNFNEEFKKWIQEEPVEEDPIQDLKKGLESIRGELLSACRLFR